MSETQNPMTAKNVMFSQELLNKATAPSWKDCPTGTVAYSPTGANWTKQANGWWKANGGDAFPTPGGDAVLVRIPNSGSNFMTTTPEAVEAALQYSAVIPFYSVPEKTEVFQRELDKVVWFAADGESVELATIRILAARVRELEREQSQDTKRLDFLLKHISVDDVADECVALGICVNQEAMEEALSVGKKDESGRSPLLVKSWDDNIRDVIDRAIESHGHPQPEHGNP